MGRRNRASKATPSRLAPYRPDASRASRLLIGQVAPLIASGATRVECSVGRCMYVADSWLSRPVAAQVTDCDGGRMTECDALGARLELGDGTPRDEQQASQTLSRACT